MTDPKLYDELGRIARNLILFGIACIAISGLTFWVTR